MKLLADACQFNVHHMLSVHRRFKIIPHLNPECEKVVDNSVIDDFLFNTKFAHTMKNEQEIKNAGADFKKKTWQPSFEGPSSQDQQVPTILRRINTEENASNLAGRLLGFLQGWENLTKERAVLDRVQGFKIPFNKKYVPHFEPQVQISNKLLPEYKKSFQDMLNIGAIEECHFSVRQFVSSYFLIKKPSGSYRFILNLKPLNTFLFAPSSSCRIIERY